MAKAPKEEKKVRGMALAGIIMGVVGLLVLFIGAISYFGVLDVSEFVPNTCKLDGNLDCPQFDLAVDEQGVSTLYLRVRNLVFDQITVTDVRIKEQDALSWCEATNSLSTEILKGQQGDISAQLSQAPCGIELGDQQTYHLEVDYVKAGSQVENTAVGRMIAVAHSE